MVLTKPQQQTILNSEIAAVVLGLGEQFALFPDTEDTDAAIKRGRKLGRLGYKLVGVIAINGGRASVVLAADNPTAAFTMIFAALEFLKSHSDFYSAHHEVQS
jgi:hypothetical protein